MSVRRIVVGTSREKILDVARRWHSQYGDHYDDMGWGDKAVIGEQLNALDPETATAGEVNAIIGNPTWTQELCGICEERVERWVRIGPSDFDDTGSVNVCATCLVVAREVIRG